MPEISFDTLTAITEQLGVVLLLILNIVAIWKRWFVPYYVVEELRSRAERAEVDGRYWREFSLELLTGTKRTIDLAERTHDLILATKGEAQKP